MPASTPQWFGTGALIEQEGSPLWQTGEKTTVTETYRGDWDLARASLPPRGVLGVGQLAGLRVAGGSVVREKGGIGLLTIQYEGLLDGEETQVPPDEPELEYSQQEFAIENHAKFAVLTDDTIALCHDCANAKTGQERADLEARLQEGIEDLTLGGFPDQAAAVEALFTRLNRGETHYSLNMPLVKFSSYYTSEPETDGGGYFEVPSAPITIPSGWTWMRLPDSKGYNQAFWKLTRSWQALKSPDTYIYPVP